MKSRVVMLSDDPELALLRHYILQSAGYDVISPRNEKEAEKVIQEHDMDIAVLCHRLSGASARQLIRCFRENNPNGKIVAMVHVYGEWPEIEADRYIVGTDGPEALLHVLTEMQQA